MRMKLRGWADGACGRKATVAEATIKRVSTRRVVDGFIACAGILSPAQRPSYLRTLRYLINDAGSTRVALASGTRLGSYEMASQVGAGGMGEVYQAHDTKLTGLLGAKRPRKSGG